MKSNNKNLDIASVFNTAAQNVITKGFYPEMITAIDNMSDDLFIYGFPASADMEYNADNDYRRTRAVTAKKAILHLLGLAVANALNVPGNAQKIGKADVISLQLLLGDFGKDEILQGLEDLAMCTIMSKWKALGSPTDYNGCVMHPYNMYQKMKILISGYIYPIGND